MKKFDGILLLSDWDGTLHSPCGVSSENKVAIKYFQDNGGIFTICSGRAKAFLAEHTEGVQPNTYAVCLNGAYIANLNSGDILHAGACDNQLFDIIDKLFVNSTEYEKIFMYSTDSETSTIYTQEEYLEKTKEIKSKEYYKAVLCAKSDEHGDIGAARASKYNFDGYSVVRSFRGGIEILKSENTKGEALKRLAKHHNSRLTVAVGDYENDIVMIRAADIGYAVENAQPSVKLAADRITAAYTQSAIAKIIKDLEFEVLPKIK